MPNSTDPAATAGGIISTSTHPALAGLPAKVRVHALAKLLDRSSREVIDALTALGGAARSAQSSIDRDLALRVAEQLLGDGDSDGAAPTEPADAVEAEAPAETAVSLDGPAGAPAFAEREEPASAAPFTPVFAAPSPVFLPPTAAAPVKAKPKAAPPVVAEPAPAAVADEQDDDADDQAEDTAATDADDDGSDASRRRRRRGRRGRGRGKGGQGDDASDEGGEDDEAPADTGEDAERDDQAAGATDADDGDDDGEGGGNRRRRRRRRRKGSGDDPSGSGEDDPPNTVVHVRAAREERSERTERADAQDEVRSVRGSTRLEAKRQRRRDGREAGRRRVPILSESEFLARREAVDRKMVVNQRGESVQIGVLEDGVLVEHFVTSAGSGSLVGNVYLGRVQNVLPSMEAAFVDIGRGRNAVLYAGEVDWDAAGLEGKARKIEQALSTGDSVLVQVTKDPVGHKGARLTTQISMPGRFLVYVPGGGATGISRKLPDTERKRLKDVLKRVVPEDAGVIIRTASEGVSEEELGRDVRRLRAQWEVIQERAGQRGVKAPELLYEEPDLLIKVVRDLFTEDFSALTVQGDTAWDTIQAYVTHVAPDLVDRLRRHVGQADVFTEFRIDEQILKALDRKVWLPSGGYLVIDRTEAMTVVDVNTGKFTGSGGNLEETVTRNNLEAAEEIVRQLRLRDIGGIIVVDFIDMVLESNRDLVLRRLTECLGRDRTRHQVAEVTSLGLVQMTRKRVGTGLLEAFSTNCEHCRGRGVLVSTTPVHATLGVSTGNGGSSSGGSSGGGSSNGHGGGAPAEEKGGRRNRRRGGGHGDDQAESGAGNRQDQQARAPQPEPAQPEPVEPVAVEPAVVESAPVDATPVESAGEHPEPVEAIEVEEPARGRRSARREPGQPRARRVRREAGPAQPDAAPPEPVVIESVKAEPVQPEPVNAAPVNAEPDHAASVAAPVTTVADEAPAESPQPAHTNGHQPAEQPESAGEQPVAATASRQPAPRPVRRRAASRPAGPPVGQAEQQGEQTPV